MISTSKELKELIHKGESETLEFKSSFGKETIQTAGAFANTKGGIILIGIGEKHQIIGTSISNEALKNWVNRISNASEPKINSNVENIQINNKSVVVISIKEIPFKPVSISGRCYRRIGPSNRIMTIPEISEMHYQSIHTTWDASPYPNGKINDIDFNKVRKYVIRTNKTGRKSFKNIKNIPSILNKINFVQNKVPSRAAVIAFGKNPPLQAKVKCGVIKGTSTIIDDYIVDVPLLDQVEEVMNYLKRVLRLSYSITGKAERDEIWEYPLEALREAVTNAICHRDYSFHNQIQIKIFDDQLTIWNPGGLPTGMSIERLMDPDHKSIPRNQLLAMLFHDTKLIENLGSGIQRILDECEELGTLAPDFMEVDGGFQVTFPKDIYNEPYLIKKGLNERQIKAVLHVKNIGGISNKDYRELNSVSNKTAFKDLADLENRKIFIRHGVGRSTVYILKEQKNDEKV